MKRKLVSTLVASLPIIASPCIGATDQNISIQLGEFRLVSKVLMTQVPDMLSIGERSSVVIGGSVVKVNASNEPLQSASSQTIVIKVSKVYAGEEIVGTQSGQLATIVLTSNSPSGVPAALKVGSQMIFFGNPKFIGKSVTIIALGQVPERETLASGRSFEAVLQSRRDWPIKLVLQVSDMVYRGKVEKIEPLDEVVNNERRIKEPESEHDPDWHIANVLVTSNMRGVNDGATVKVLFAASRDIVWVSSPKLREGQEGIFITRKPAKEEEILMRATGAAAAIERLGAQLLTHHAAYQLPSEEARVRALVRKVNG
jgi:hypothetical protein